MKTILASILVFTIRIVVYCFTAPPLMDTALILGKIRALVPTDQTFLQKVIFLKV